MTRAERIMEYRRAVCTGDIMTADNIRRASKSNAERRQMESILTEIRAENTGGYDDWLIFEQEDLVNE